MINYSNNNKIKLVFLDFQNIRNADLSFTFPRYLQELFIKELYYLRYV